MPDPSGPEAGRTPFKPSQVYLGERLMDTFNHSEAENTAAVIIQVLADNGDVWRSAMREELAEGFARLTNPEGFWRTWFNNPFMRIDMHDLVKRGFAVWDGEKAIQFTDTGLQRLEKWVRL